MLGRPPDVRYSSSIDALPPASVAQSAVDTFPAEPFNGMQIQYSVSGVSVGAPEDTPGTTYTREYRGSATSNNIHVTGYFIFTGAASKGGTTWDCSVRLYTEPFFTDETILDDGFSLRDQVGSKVPFDVWLNVPGDQETVDVRIEMNGQFANWQDRDVQVDLILKNPNYGTSGGSGGYSDPGSSDGDSGGCCCSAVVLPLLIVGAVSILVRYIIHKFKIIINQLFFSYLKIFIY
jgi:hypothetical protein